MRLTTRSRSDIFPRPRDCLSGHTTIGLQTQPYLVMMMKVMIVMTVMVMIVLIIVLMIIDDDVNSRYNR